MYVGFVSFNCFTESSLYDLSYLVKQKHSVAYKLFIASFVIMFKKMFVRLIEVIETVFSRSTHILTSTCFHEFTSTIFPICYLFMMFTKSFIRHLTIHNWIAWKVLFILYIVFDLIKNGLKIITLEQNTELFLSIHIVTCQYSAQLFLIDVGNFTSANITQNLLPHSW